MSRRVASRAEVAFLEAQVFATRERTGILIFISLFERGVVILGDEGINARVEQAEWDGMVAALTAGIRSGRPIEALEDAIRDCGELLASRRVERRADDVDELPNALRMADE
jgi:putative membrane protein